MKTTGNPRSGQKVPKPDTCKAWPAGIGDRRIAFTRADLLAVFGAILLLVLLAWPAGAGRKRQSEQGMCLVNLYQIGRAFQSWGNDHGDRRPWRVPQSEGGTFPSETGIKSGSAWREFAWISNDLAHAKFFACPGDRGTRRVAQEFSANPDGGFLNPGFRNNALSYFVGLDTYPDTPREILSGDRNFDVDLSPAFCNAGINNAAGIFKGEPTGNVRWTNSIHGLQGNLLRNDGSVEMMDQRQFAEAWQTGDPFDAVHVLMPK
jgi:hypothetical protein